MLVYVRPEAASLKTTRNFLVKELGGGTNIAEASDLCSKGAKLSSKSGAAVAVIRKLVDRLKVARQSYHCMMRATKRGIEASFKCPLNCEIPSMSMKPDLPLLKSSRKRTCSFVG